MGTKGTIRAKLAANVAALLYVSKYLRVPFVVARRWLRGRG